LFGSENFNALPSRPLKVSKEVQPNFKVDYVMYVSEDIFWAVAICRASFNVCIWGGMHFANTRV